jgi:hypothetical protein
MQLTKPEKYIIGTLIIVLILCVFKLCNNSEKPNTLKNINYIDTLELSKEKDVTVQKLKDIHYRRIIDSISNIKNKVLIKYIKVRDIAIRDTNKAVQELIVDCDSLNLINALTVTYKDSTIDSKNKIISDYKDIIMLKNYTHSNDSLNIIGLNDNIKRQKKRVIKAKIGGGLIAILSAGFGFGVGKVMP